MCSTTTLVRVNSKWSEYLWWQFWQDTMDFLGIEVIDEVLSVRKWFSDIWGDFCKQKQKEKKGDEIVV